MKEPKLPYRLKWGDRTTARVDEVDYLIGIRLVGYTGIKDVIIVEVHESVADEVGVSEDEFMSYVYCNAGTLEEPGELVEEEAPKHKTIGELIKEHEGVSGIQFSTDERGNVQAAYIRGKHGGMKLVSMGDGLENVSSKIWEEKVWKH